MKNYSILFLILLLVLTMPVMSQNKEEINRIVKEQSKRSYELCTYLHQNPELSTLEFETAKRMATELEQAGMEVRTGFAGNSVVGILKSGEGPVVMLRTDMDALPIEEKTGLEFASRKMSENSNGDEVTVMHACGHDIHMSVWAGTIHSLVALKDQWEGTLMVIAQQAEEISQGAGPAIKAGLFSEFPVPDYALAYHINPELESGTIGLVSGPVFAGVKTVNITVYGKGGHGAYPEKCIDPVVIASRIVLNLQTIVSREISPLDPVVVTVGSIHGGTRPNIIPDEVKMELTLRYYSTQVIEDVIDAIKRISNAAAAMSGMPEDRFPLVYVVPKDTPPVINDDLLSLKIKEFSGQTIGGENIVETSPAMVGEDFGKYGLTPEDVPICLIWLGSTAPEEMKKLKEEGKEPFPLHSPFLNPDYENTIGTGIEVMVRNVLGLMKK